MPLTSGTKLGPYEIQSPLGAGGMGEVYRARDTRLDRTVAVKILPSHLSSNPEAKQRFEREARTISSLNHPNICVLHDVGSQDGTSYLVMEFVDGETLDSRLQKGPLPLKQVLECGVQICDALEKAHRAGIVHRDLKPGNVMLTSAGAKLLDFGLAKPVAAMLGGQDLGNRGTMTPSTPTMNLTALSASPAALTQRGTIVGTFQYMAPEAVQGKEADARSDIFSFGCVLYEMITGKRAFEGKSQLSVLTAILEKEPDALATVQPTTPPALDYAVQTCLQKNPDERFQTAHDVKLQLAFVAKAGSQTGTAAVEAGKKNKSAIWFALLAGALALALLAAAFLWSGQQPARVVRAHILPPPGAQFETMYRNGPPSISPDGSRVAFVAQKDGKRTIWVRSLDQLDASPVHGTEDGFYPFWSPDGTELGFFKNGKLWRVNVNSGAPTAICDAPEARGGTWGKENEIVFAPTAWGPIEKVSAGGGIASPITKTAFTGSGLSDRWPFSLPDGKHILFLHATNGAGDDNNEVHLIASDGSGEQTLLKGRFYMVQYASGWLLADRAGSLLAWKLDAANGKLSGDGVQVVDKIANDDVASASVFSVSSKGVLLYQAGLGATGERHVWQDATGKELAQISEPSVYGGFRLSPDGSRIATPMPGRKGDITLWAWDLVGGTRAQLSSGDGVIDLPVWSSDGRTIYFGNWTGRTHYQIWEVPSDGSRPNQLLIKAAKADGDVRPVDCSSDGKWLLYEETNNDAQHSTTLKAFPLSGGPDAFAVLDSVMQVSNARFKPTANDWLAYQSNATGRSEIYLSRFPHPGARYQVTQNGGSQPVWSRNGKTLFYLDSNQRINAVEIQTANDSVQIGPAKTLFQTGVRSSIPSEGYDIAPDGKFLTLSSGIANNAPVVLVTNWEAELKK